MANTKSTKQADDLKAVISAIDAMPSEEKVIGQKLHNLISKAAPELMPRTWYGMPAYSNGDKIVCFFRSKVKFGERYLTLGFNDTAKLDDGNVWPIYFAITNLTAADEANIAKLVHKAVGT